MSRICVLQVYPRGTKPTTNFSFLFISRVTISQPSLYGLEQTILLHLKILKNEIFNKIINVIRNDTFNFFFV